MYYSDDPVRDFERYDAQRERELARRPKCCECDEPIQEDHCFEINDELVCIHCLKRYYLKGVEDYIE